MNYSLAFGDVISKKFFRQVVNKNSVRNLNVDPSSL